MKFRRRYWVLALLFAVSIITYLDRICISVAGSTMQKELGLSATQWGWVLGAFALAYSLFELPTGALGDRVGPRSILTRIVLWWSGFTALTAAAFGLWQLIGIRFLFGVGEAGAFPNMSCAISRWFPRVERARAQAVVWMASRVGGALAPLMVIPLLQFYGWRVMFVALASLGIVWVIVWRCFFKDSPAQDPGVSAVELAEIGEGNPIRKVQHRRWREVLACANLWWLMAMYFSHVWCAFFFTTWLFPFLEKGRDFTKAELLHLAWLPYVCGAGANLLGGFTSDFLVSRIGLRWSRRIVGVVGHGISCVSLAAAVMSSDKLVVIVCLAIAYAGSDFTLPVAWAVCLDIGGKDTGLIAGAMNTAGNLGGFLSTIAFGSIVDAFGSYDRPLILTAGIAALSAVLWLKIDPLKSMKLSADPALSL